MSRPDAGIPPGLVTEARAGDDLALRRLVEAAYTRVRRWALVHTGDPMEADDLSQDVMVKMLRKLHTFEGNARFDTWLYAMTRNAARDRIRRRRKHDDPGR